MVLVFHFDLVPFAGGFTGVDVFFVISGYLITSIILRRMEGDHFSLLEFFTNRIRRLAPALFATNLLVMAAGLILLFPDDLTGLAKQIIAAQSYVANFYYWRSLNYFGLPAQSAYMLHTWSLAVEEQFYLFFPFALLVVRRYAKQYLLSAIAAAMLGSFVLNILFVGLKPEATFYLLPTRAWELFAGAMLVKIRTNDLSRPARETLGGIGAACIFAGFAGYSSVYDFPGYFALLPTLGAAAIIASGATGDTFVGNVLRTRLLNYIGRISYPLYLVHWPLKVFVDQQLSMRNLPVRLAELVVSIGLAALIYGLVEGPLRSSDISPRRVLRAYGLGLLLALSVAFAAILDAGFPSRFPQDAIRFAGFTRDRTREMPECEFRGQWLRSPRDLCEIGNRSQPLKWLIYGDSHAWAAYGAFDQWLKDKGEAGLFIFRHQCVPLVGINVGRDNDCRVFNDRIVAFAEASSIENVFLVSSWRQIKEGLISDDMAGNHSVPQSLESFRKAFPRTLQQLHRAGKRLVIWEPLPGAREPVPQGLARLALQGRLASVQSIEYTDAEYRSSVDFFLEAMRLANGFAEAFSPERALCQKGSCSVLIGDSPVYFDGGHLTASTLGFWVRQLHEQVDHGRPLGASTD